MRVGQGGAGSGGEDPGKVIELYVGKPGEATGS